MKMQPSDNYFAGFYSNSSGPFNNNRIHPNFNVDNSAGPTPFLNNSNSTITQNNTQAAQTIDDLRSVNEILPRYRGIFASYPCFNIIQSRIFDVVLYSDESVVVSAPTGSGKTAIFELAIVRFLTCLENYGQEQPISYKIVYVAPMKALCEERVVDWHRKFASLGLSCLSVTGDSDNIDFQTLLNHNLIITTPEKWDSVTRRWRDNKTLASLVKLFMIDEAHLLSDDQRGPTLEAVVCRMKTMQDLTVRNDNAMKMRFVAVSASIPNAEDVAEWLSTPTVPARSFKFGDEMRPVKLKKVVLGYPYSAQTSTPFKFDLMLSYKLQSIMLQHAEGKPTLVFCSTRKSVEMTSKQIIQNITINLNPQQKQILQAAASTIIDSRIREMLASGVCYHHAGLAPEDRRSVEDLFRNANLPILVTTSTLAMGVNLPAHLVIVKSTKYYSNGEYQDYTESMLLQMIGRAGRPQFDTSATAVILTTVNDKKKYENMVGGEQPVESSLHKHLTEHLNAEVVLHTITDLGVAMQWLTSTFLYIRARKHPRYYAFPQGLTLDQIDKKLLDMCQIQINRLARAGMLTIDQNDIRITTTSTGALMAKYCIAFDTMRLFTEVTGKEILQQILNLISRCHEFSEIYLRVNDKKALNLLNKCRNRETIRFPFNGKIKTVDMKINCIIQAVFGCLQIVDQSLITESQKIMRIGERISKCLAEYLETKGNCYSALLSALVLAKCFHTRLWENSPFVSKQLSGIGSVFSSMLVAAGKTSFKALLESNPRDIERILNRKSPMGNTIQDQVEHLPDYELTLEEVMGEERFFVNLRVCLKNVQLLKAHVSVNVHSCMILLVGDTDNNMFLYEKYTHSQLIENPQIFKKFEFPTIYEHQIQAHFISEDWAGFDCNVNLVPSSIKKNQENATSSGNSNRNKGSIERNNKANLKAVPNKENTKAVPYKENTKAVPYKENTKEVSNKEPSHIQTFMHTYFNNSKVKDQKQKQVSLSRALVKPRKSDVNKENNADALNILNTPQPLEILQKFDYNVDNSGNSLTESQNNEIAAPAPTEERHLSRQNSKNLDLRTRCETNLQISPKSQTLQKLINDSIQEYKKLNGNGLPNLQDHPEYDSSRGYYLPPTIAKYPTAETDSIDNTSLVRSNNYSATVKRNSHAAEERRPGANDTFKSIFKFSQQTPVDDTKPSYRLTKNCIVNFEDSFYESALDTDESGRQSESIQFKFMYTPKKRCSHDSNPSQIVQEPGFNVSVDNEQYSITEMHNPKSKATDQAEAPKYDIKEFPGANLRNDAEASKAAENTLKSGDNYQKTLKWRSPLVTSPIIRHSPNLDKNLKHFREPKEESVSLSSSINSNDIAIIANPFNKPQFKFNIRVNHDTSETSTSPSEANTSRPTLRQNMSNPLPLSDQAHSQSVAQKQTESFSSSFRSTQVEDALLSSTLLENLGLVREKSDVKGTALAKQPSGLQVVNLHPKNPVKVAPMKKKVVREAEYYSQLLLEGDRKVAGEQKVEDPVLKNNEHEKMASKLKVQLQNPHISQSNSFQQPINPPNSQAIDTSKQATLDRSSTDWNMDNSFFQPISPATKEYEPNQNSVDRTTSNLFNQSLFDFSADQNLFTSQPSREQNVTNPLFGTFKHSSYVPSCNQHPMSDLDLPISHKPKPSVGFPRVISGSFQHNPPRKRLGRYGSVSKFAGFPARQMSNEFGGFRTSNCHWTDCHQHASNPTQSHLGFQQGIQNEDNYRNHHQPASQMYNLKGATEPLYRGRSASYHHHPRVPMIGHTNQNHYFEPQPGTHTSPDCWDTMNDNYFSNRFLHSVHGHAKRQKLQQIQYRAPSPFRGHTFHDRDGFYTMKPRCYSQRESIPHPYIPHQYKYSHPPSVQYGATYGPTYNQSDKQLMLQRYLNSGDQNEVKEFPMERSSQFFKQDHLDFSNFSDEVDQDEDEDFSLN